MNTGEIHPATRLRRTYRMGVNDYKAASKRFTLEVASQVRDTLVPILQRWGVGLRGHSGGWVYPAAGGVPIYNPVVDIEGRVGWGNKEINVFLRLIHYELWLLLTTFDEIQDEYLYHYIEDIPLPRDASYVWITWEEGGSIVNAVECGTEVEEGMMSYGPVTREFYEDICSMVEGEGDLNLILHALPCYVAGLNNTWIAEQ